MICDREVKPNQNEKNHINKNKIKMKALIEEKGLAGPKHLNALIQEI